MRRCFTPPCGRGSDALSRSRSPDGERSRVTLEPRSRRALLMRVRDGSRGASSRACFGLNRAFLCLIGA
jgi:hypothetical protein